MHPPALGSAAATLVVSLIYLFWPPPPDLQVRAARASGPVTHEARPGSQQAQPPASTALLQEPECAPPCEIARGRATVHWTEYLAFRQSAGVRAQSKRVAEGDK